ncbi:YceI family protein [[Kitasatospora] papulosa]|uniref:YceI family protein n=1 Tax=[Kitasatospora] papulosa TaxID=1464011 RepID=A0ABZ1KCS9_9ACTN|nr:MULTISPECIES: YceI family protein [Streptomyces]RAS28955.1 polyisoprenoid-binding protein YceI [Streptomyces avidinii]TPM84827.1 YceI family protein [Mesorhizobium sp. B2-3-3]SNX78650.1 Polyisoprenoid-binding protein YceI [Streptomyces microflavus]MCX4416966.1 YceI family protein [[Kitasatospora] papulosa]MCY1654768.1 YceI family protein [Streptomyces sp. SL203]
MNLFSRSSLLRRPEPRPEESTADPAGAGAAAMLDPRMAALTGEWMIDPAHSRIGFSVRHAMVTTVRGAFTEYESRLYFDGRDPARSRAEISMATASVDTGVEQRDAHLIGRDFLDARNHPRIGFTSTAVQLIGKDVYRMTGDLTIRGVTGPVVLDLTYIGHVTDPFGYERVGFDGTTTINRSDWGLTYNARLAEGGAMVSERLRLQFDIAAIRTPTTA